MDTCIIHYDGQSNYSDLSPVTVKVQDRILLAKQLHEESNDEHVTQCHSIPEQISQCFFHMSPCYKKFVKITEKKGATIVTPVRQPTKRCGTRSTRKTPVSSPELPLKKRKTLLPERRQLRRRESDSSSSSKSRNRFVFPPECQICGKLELRYKNSDRVDIREEPLKVTLDDCATNTRAVIETREEYKHLKDQLLTMSDWIAAEFKCHRRCR